MAIVYTSAGKAYVSQKLSGANTNTPNKIGWGTGAGTSAIGDTTLFTEDSGGSPVYARATATLSTITTTVTNDTFQADGTITSNGTKTITNAGLFDAATTGNLIVKGDHAGVPLLLNDSIEYIITLQQS